MKKVAVIFGTRPEAIKLCPVILAMQEDPAFDCEVCVTGQHREMLQQVLDIFDVHPNEDFSLMQPNQTLGEFTARAITAIDAYLSKTNPDVVMVQGDTTTVLCGALSAFYHHIPIAHVEAGLRTGNMLSPWPEEANRVLTTRLAKWHFAPTENNKENLLKEGVSSTDIFVTGNTVIDALLLAKEKVEKMHGGEIDQMIGLPAGFMDSGRRMVLITGHRRENFGEGFNNICNAIKILAQRFPDVDFVYPVHLNPNVRKPVNQILGECVAKNVWLIAPQGYLSFVALMNRAYLVLTDSGGVQEEAPGLGKPTLVMRDTTERPEAICAGTVKLVGTDRSAIVKNVASLLDDECVHEQMAHATNPYGDGMAVKRILEVLK